MSETTFDKACAIIRRLQEEGHEACLAGGCVRDRLLGLEPKDYDIATSALPDQVEALFRRTIGVGKHFGVVIVQEGRDTFDVATFRSDGSYADGRRPDSVEFVTAEEDVKRRDFTINGLLYDPIADEVIDHVGGQADLEAKLIRAIGDPDERFEEDHLRLLRAVRFACRLGFDIEENTRGAVQRHAALAATPSAERVGGELSKMFGERAPLDALVHLESTGMLKHVLPEVQRKLEDETAKKRTTAALASIDDVHPALSWAFLLEDLDPAAMPRAGARAAGAVLERLRHSKQQITCVERLVLNRDRLLFATRVSRARRRIIGADPDLDLILAYQRIGRTASGLPDGGPIAEAGELPAPLVNGNDVADAGGPRGRRLGWFVRAIRWLQLEGRLASADEAKRWVAARLVR